MCVQSTIVAQHTLLSELINCTEKYEFWSDNGMSVCSIDCKSIETKEKKENGMVVVQRFSIRLRARKDQTAC